MDSTLDAGHRLTLVSAPATRTSPREAPRLWLFGVARHVLSNHRREHERRDRLHLRLATLDAEPLTYDSGPPAEQTLWPALAALPAEQRELLLLRAWDGLGVGEIATLLAITPANVSSRLHKARQRLRQELRRRDPDPVGQVSGDPHGERSHHHDRSR